MKFLFLLISSKNNVLDKCGIVFYGKLPKSYISKRHAQVYILQEMVSGSAIENRSYRFILHENTNLRLTAMLAKKVAMRVEVVGDTMQLAIISVQNSALVNRG